MTIAFFASRHEDYADAVDRADDDLSRQEVDVDTVGPADEDLSKRDWEGVREETIRELSSDAASLLAAQGAPFEVCEAARVGAWVDFVCYPADEDIEDVGTEDDEAEQ